MAYVVRRGSERGRYDWGWLDTRHTFSFGDYHDPRWMGFRALRVINDDRVKPAKGFGTHGHRDMEIVSYVLAGALEHKDSMGTGSVIRPGDVQRMSAGTGVQHSEFNASQTDPVRFLQIWIIPAARGIAPSYEQKTFPEAEKRDRLRLVASPDGAEGSVTLHQDVRMYSTLLSPGAKVSLPLAPKRFAWIQVANGTVRAGEHALTEGDGLGLTDVPEVALEAVAPSEVVVFDLA